jgi:acetyltransferase-like isoleucine patch superfamily enzyme
MLTAFVHLLARATGREPHGAEARARGLGWGVRFHAPGLRIGRHVEVVGAERVQLGANVTLAGNVHLNAAGSRGSLAIGVGTHLDQFCVVYAQGGVTIGERCAIASGVTIYSQSNQFASDPQGAILDQPVVYAPVHIGDDVWIGARAVILPGVSIGDHAVIGAGAVVRSDVPSWHIATGVPARSRGDRRERAIR